MTQINEATAKAFETQVTYLFASQSWQDSEQRMKFWKWLEQNPKGTTKLEQKYCRKTKIES